MYKYLEKKNAEAGEKIHKEASLLGIHSESVSKVIGHIVTHQLGSLAIL